jgi:hypothetical protein
MHEQALEVGYAISSTTGLLTSHAVCVVVFLNINVCPCVCVCVSVSHLFFHQSKNRRTI